MAVAGNNSRTEVATIEKLRRADDVRKEGGQCGSRRVFSPGKVEAFVQWFVIQNSMRNCFDFDLLER